VLSGSGDKTIKLWDAATGALIRTFAGHSYRVSSVAFSTDGSRVLSGSLDGTILHMECYNRRAVGEPDCRS